MPYFEGRDVPNGSAASIELRRSFIVMVRPLHSDNDQLRMVHPAQLGLRAFFGAVARMHAADVLAFVVNDGPEVAMAEHGFSVRRLKDVVGASW